MSLAFAMYEQFTDQARKAFQEANWEAQRFNHEYIGTEHILLGLVAQEDGVAVEILKSLDVSLRRVRKQVEAIYSLGPDLGSWQGKLLQTPRAKNVIAYAIEEARRCQHDYIGTEHLLLGLLRDQDTVAAQILLNLGVDLNRAREALTVSLGGSSSQQDAPQHTEVVARQRNVAPIHDYPADIKAAAQQVDESIARLREKTETAIADADFERAARLRDESLKLQQRKIAILHEWALAYPPAPSWLSWQGGEIATLARIIREEGRWDQLPALADSLKTAGCTDAEVLSHCRQPPEHCDRCWVVDWLLGKL